MDFHKIIPKCKKCHIEMEKGTALENTLVGFPDFPGDTGLEDGCTMSRVGPPQIVPCWKCPQCGYSIKR